MAGFRSKYRNVSEADRKKKQVIHNQIERKVGLARKQARDKTNVTTVIPDDWALDSNLAYGQGYWLHTYAANFQNNLFQSEISDALQIIVDAIKGPLETIRSSVEPNDGDKQAYHIIEEEPNLVFDTFTKFNKAIDSLSTGMGTSTETKNAEIPLRVNIDESKLIEALINNKIVSKKTKTIVDESGRIADQNLSGLLNISRVMGSKRTINEDNYLTIIENLQNLLTMSQAVTKKFNHELNKKSSDADNKTFEQLVELFQFAKDGHLCLEDMIKQAKSGIGVTRKLGYYFELAFLAAYGGTSVGTKKKDWSAADVQLLKNSLIAENNKLKNAVSISLKRSDRIAREVNVESILNNFPQLEQQLRVIKYFLTNFTLINEYQNDIEEVTFHDTPLLSISEINSLYTEIVNKFGQFVFANLIVGYILANKPLQDQYLKDLPHLLVTADKHVYYTSDLISAVQKQVDSDAPMGDIIVNYTAGLASDYLAFVGHKKDAYRSAIAKNQPSYEGLLSNNSKVQSLYNQISKEMDSLTIWGAINTAKLLNKANNQLKTGGQ